MSFAHKVGFKTEKEYVYALLDAEYDGFELLETLALHLPDLAPEDVETYVADWHSDQVS